MTFAELATLKSRPVFHDVEPVPNTVWPDDCGEVIRSQNEMLTLPPAGLLLQNNKITIKNEYFKKDMHNSLIVNAFAPPNSNTFHIF